MGLEIERKFLVCSESWRKEVVRSLKMKQGYLSGEGGRASVRVRLEGEEARLNIKAARVGAARAEYEWPIAADEAREILATLCAGLVEKTRHYIPAGPHTFEVDEFEGANAGLIVAEIELDSADEAFERPAWLGRELTEDRRYYNHYLSTKPYSRWPQRIEVDVAAQKLRLLEGARSLREYTVSTSGNGLGEQNGSGQTPRGRHKIRAMIGRGAPSRSVFVCRRPTGEVHSNELAAAHPNRDWILTRILWLSGLEPGKNRLGAVDTMRRFIYIHGTPDESVLGRPGSKGCIRMRNEDIVELFDAVKPGIEVLIHE
jgi:adenylate cyclase